jgi:alkanesulfonate monooxygenase SsuD/methylene tetrahydromethanopterin reductase-like flavin-dependent oxidoreductase (luciferase family)
MKVRIAVSVGTGPPDPDALAATVTEVEARGFDTLWVSDLPVLPSTDPFLAVATAAAVTTRLKLGVNIVPFGYPPFVFARQVAQLDQLTRGRLLLTLVPGLDLPGERAALGIGARHRGRLLDATIPVLRDWWAGREVAVGPDGWPAEPGTRSTSSSDQAGPWPLALPTRPLQDPLEVWLGGSGPEAIDRAGRLADGWLGALMAVDEAVARKTQIESVAHQAGRTIDPEHFGLSLAYARQAEDLERAPRLRRPGQAPLAPLVPVGAAALRDLVGRLVDGGLSKFVVRPVAPLTPGNDELAWLADNLLDLQT